MVRNMVQFLLALSPGDISYRPTMCFHIMSNHATPPTCLIFYDHAMSFKAYAFRLWLIIWRSAFAFFSYFYGPIFIPTFSPIFWFPPKFLTIIRQWFQVLSWTVLCSWCCSPPDPESDRMLRTANFAVRTGAVSATLGMVPFQPIYFAVREATHKIA